MLRAKTILGIALLLAFAEDSTGQSQRGSRSNSPSAQSAQPSASDQRGTDQSPFSVKILPGPNAEREAEEKKRESHEKAAIDKKLADETEKIARYTFWLGLFTLALFFAAVGQIALFYIQLRYMRDEVARSRSNFIATHRPRVIVRFIQGPFIDEGHQVIWVTIANVGVSDATIEAWGGDLARRNKKGTWTAGLEAGPVVIQPAITLISGQRHTFTVRARHPYGDALMFADATGDNQLCAVGGIRYRDSVGITRETGFLRVYDEESESFVPSKNQEDEYQD